MLIGRPDDNYVDDDIDDDDDNYVDDDDEDDGYHVPLPLHSNGSPLSQGKTLWLQNALNVLSHLTSNNGISTSKGSASASASWPWLP